MSLDELKIKICDLKYEGEIDHATFCNAVHYINGDYEPRNHTLCRNAFKRCLRALEDA